MVFAFSMHPLGNPRYYGDDRTEQHGRVAGRLIAPGIDEQVEGFMIRDHSWGPRIWGLNQHYKWFHAVTAASSIHFFEMDSFGRRQVRGYLYRDGVLGNIRSVDYDVEYDDQMLHRRLRGAVVDTEGRTAHVDAVTFASVPMEFDPMVYNSEAAVTVDIDGLPGTGWSEFCWNRNYLDYARQYRRDVRIASLYSVLNKFFDVLPEILIGAAVDVVVNQKASFLARAGIVDPKAQLVLLAILGWQPHVAR